LTKGIIVPVPKNGNSSDVNNYRGITLTSGCFVVVFFSIICSIMLESRLRRWAKTINLLSDYQFGFCKDKRTIDCIFALNLIINKVKKIKIKHFIVHLSIFLKLLMLFIGMVYG
jgi:hypothetical protein